MQVIASLLGGSQDCPESQPVLVLYRDPDSTALFVRTERRPLDLQVRNPDAWVGQFHIISRGSRGIG